MDTKDDVEALEKLIGQLAGLHAEVSQLSKKSPSDGVNKFKLDLVNSVIKCGNGILGAAYQPFSELKQFYIDDVPTNSDVTIILSQYIEQTKRYRSDNTVRKPDRRRTNGFT